MKVEEQAASYYIEPALNTSLPLTNYLNINALSAIFQHSTNAYKFLFFLALLKQLETKKENNEHIFVLDNLAIEMAVLAWYPLKFFHLSLGKQDQIGKIVSYLNTSEIKYNITHPSFQNALKVSIKQQYKKIKLKQIIKYVPYRLLSSFFHQQLKGIKDSQKNKIITQLSNEGFTDNISLYRFVEHNQQQAIQINPEWENYLRINFKIIHSWALWKWSCYLQLKNPNTPAILNKITPPTIRQSLSAQTAIWKEAIKAGMQLNCIYTGENLSNKSFALDHFLPWSFVGHNQLWNLTPVITSVNSIKSNHLPPKESIFLLAEQQYELLILLSKSYSSTRWTHLIEHHVNDLHLDEKDILSEPQFQQAYQNTLKPLLTLAHQAGFKKMILT